MFHIILSECSTLISCSEASASQQFKLITICPWQGSSGTVEFNSLLLRCFSEVRISFFAWQHGYSGLM